MSKKIQLFIFGLIVGIMLALYVAVNASNQIKCTYEKSIVVDKSEKIALAISNAMHDVQSRNFEIVYLTVTQRSITKDFKITCGGCDKGDILNLD